MAGPGSDRRAAARFLSAAESHGIALDDFWGVADETNGPFRAAALLVLSSGSTVMAFASPVDGSASIESISRMIDRACEEVKTGKLAQTLLEIDEAAAQSAFERAGFVWVGDLLYLRRPWTKPEPMDGDWPTGVTIETWRQGDEEALATALERSYIDTQDCPELCGLRSTQDVIESHRATGVFDPALWWIVRANGAPAGVLLLNVAPDQDHTELVYLGLGPELRGRGLATRLLRHGLGAIALDKHRAMVCAVDARNGPARKLYSREGFHEFSRRRALVRPIGRSVRQPPATT